MERFPTPNSPDNPDNVLPDLNEEETKALEKVLRLDLREPFPAEDSVLEVSFNPAFPPVPFEQFPALFERIRFEMGFREVKPVVKLDPNLMGLFSIRIIPGTCTNRKFIPVMTRMAKAIIEAFLTLV